MTVKTQCNLHMGAWTHQSLRCAVGSGHKRNSAKRSETLSPSSNQHKLVIVSAVFRIIMEAADKISVAYFSLDECWAKSLLVWTCPDRERSKSHKPEMNGAMDLPCVLF